MECRHRWQYHHSLSAARCPLCRTEIQRAGPDPDGRWHDSMPVAMKLAMRKVNIENNSGAINARNEPLRACG